MIDDAQLVQSLLQAGLVDQPTIKEGLRRRTDKSMTLYDVLLQQRLVKERDLVRLVGSILNVASVQLDRTNIQQSVLDLVPASVATRNRVIPLQVLNEQGQQMLVLGMADPLDMLAMDEVATHTGIDIRPVLVGPLELEATLQKVYAPRVSEAFAGLGDITMDVLEDANWAEFFDSAQSMGEVEDSSVISQEMRERPTTDVFEVVDDDLSGIPSLDLLELGEADPKVAARAPRLDPWNFDEDPESAEPVTQKRSRPASEIVSASGGNHLFEDVPTSRNAKVELRKVVEDEEDVGEPTMKKSLEELSEQDAVEHTGSTRTQRGLKADGEAKGGQASLRPQAEDTDNLDSDHLGDTGGGHTSMGVGVRHLTANRAAIRKSQSDTDYGELGRQILKSKPPEDEDTAKLGDTLRGVGEPIKPSNAPKTTVPEPRVRDAEVQAEPPAAPEQPVTLSAEEDELSRKPTNKFKALERDDKPVARPSVVIPEGVDTRAALEVLVEMLVRKGVVDAAELELLLNALK